MQQSYERKDLSDVADSFKLLAISSKKHLSLLANSYMQTTSTTDEHKRLH